YNRLHLCKTIKRGVNMKFKNCLSVVFILSILFSSNILLSEEINFSDEALAKEIVGGHWTCEMVDKYAGGPTPWEFEVTGRKVKGKHLNAWCPSKPGPIKGKLKKNIMKFSVARPEPCTKIAGSLKFTKDENGIVTAKGKYRFTNRETRVTGTLYCYK
ncbi:MAG: hypothetical protein ACR2PU_03385, partial [Gammaproteobacteria bacterium]